MSQTIEKTNDEKYGAMVEALNDFYWDNSISPNETAARLDKFAAEVWRLAEYIRDNDPSLDTPRSRTPHGADLPDTQAAMCSNCANLACVDRVIGRVCGEWTPIS